MSDSNTYAAKKVLGTMWTYLLLGGAFAWLGITITHKLIPIEKNSYWKPAIFTIINIGG
jgi:hypothetical protein